MKTVTATCRICRKSLSLRIDDAYDDVADPNKLLPMATCNRCYDMRDRRERLHEAIYRACMEVYQVQGKLKPPEAERILTTLTRLTKKYARLMADYRDLKDSVWAESFPKQLMEKPGDWYALLKGYRDSLRTHQPTATQQTLT